MRQVNRSDLGANAVRAVRWSLPPLVGYHFGSRQKLLEAVVDAVRDDFVADLVQSSEVGSMPGLQATVRLVDIHLSELIRDPRRGLAILVLTVNSIREMPNLQPAIRRLNDGLRHGVGDLLARGIEDGSVRADTEPAAAAVIIVAMLRGATVQWLDDPEGLNIDVARREMVAVVTSCYASGAGRAGGRLVGGLPMSKGNGQVRHLPRVKLRLLASESTHPAQGSLCGTCPASVGLAQPLPPSRDHAGG